MAQFGALDYGMRVWLDPNRLAALKLTATDVAGAIRAQNVQAMAGELGAPPFGGGASSGGAHLDSDAMRRLSPRVQGVTSFADSRRRVGVCGRVVTG